MSDSSDEEYADANESRFLSSEEEEEEDEENLSSPPSSFDMIEHVVSSASQSDELLHDIHQQQQEEEPIDEGPTSFQLNSILANANSSKDVKLLRDNFFSKPKSRGGPAAATTLKMVEDEAEETIVVESLDGDEVDIAAIPAFARSLFVDDSAATAAPGENKNAAAAPTHRRHDRPPKAYARDRIRLTNHNPIRPEDAINEGPHINYDDEVTVRGGGGETYPNTEVNLDNINLLEEIRNNLRSMGIKNLRKIQQHIIPVILSTKSDIIAYAPTGRGKTLSYLIPLVNNLVLQNRREPSTHRKPSVAILLQNHETAQQVYGIANKIAEGLELNVLPAMGHNNMALEVAKFKHGGGDIVIGTTGRFIQYVSEKKISLDKLKILVFDEADQFVKSKEWENAMDIFKHHMPPDRRTFLFSATYDDTACFSWDNFVKSNYWFIGVGELNQVESLIRQTFIMEHAVTHSVALIKLLIEKAKDGRCPKTLVFTNSIDKADYTAGRLRMFKDIQSPFPIRAAALHSLIPATDRDLIFKAFLLPSTDKRSLDVIVASDKICCGVSTPAEIVVNYDLPNDLSTYVLRAGRTGRNGHTGEAYNFVNETNMERMSYDDRKNLSSMIALAKRTDCVPLPAALEEYHRKFTRNM